MTSPRRAAQGGPPPGILAVVFTVLLLGGVVLAAATGFPSPDSAAAGIQAYFHDHPDAVRISAFLQFGAAVPLAIYAAAVSVRLRALGIRAPGAAIAGVGGILAAAFLALSGLFDWVLARPEILAEPALVRALHDLAFASGGPGHIVPLGLLIAGIAVPGWLARLLPRPLAFAGLAIAAVAEASTLSLLFDGAAFLLPIARFTGLVWLIATGFRLPRVRANRVGTNLPVSAGGPPRSSVVVGG